MGLFKSGGNACDGKGVAGMGKGTAGSIKEREKRGEGFVKKEKVLREKTRKTRL